MRDILIHFLDRIKEYEHESGHSMHEDERESSEIVDIHLEAHHELKNNGGLGDVSNNENDSEVAFCDSPIHDFDRCPLIKQTNNCKNCRYYN